MRLVYHLLTIGVAAHYLGFVFVPHCLNIERALLPIAFYLCSYACFRRLVDADPGTAIQTDEETIATNVCRFCQRHKGPFTKHCHVCGVCVDGFDHHCDVLDICVGAGNIRLFRMFLLFHGGFLFYALFHTFRLVFECVKQDSVGMPLYLTLGVLEFSFGTSFLLFWLFHACLAWWRVRTYDIVKYFFDGDDGPRAKVHDVKKDA